MKTIRYGLTKGARVWKGKEEIHINILQLEYYFIDLLEPMEEGSCRQIKINLFCPDGTIVKNVTVVGFCIKLVNKDSLFDGRFNSTQDKL
ncbi:MAG TPA: hypothetical protein VF849_00085 [Blattabacteriaceae bacterium]